MPKYPFTAAISATPSISSISAVIDHFYLSDTRDNSSANDEVSERSKLNGEANIVLFMLFELILNEARG